MEFYVQCEKCLESIVVRDGYNNEGGIEIIIIGENIVEIICNECDDSITTIDGDII